VTIFYKFFEIMAFKVWVKQIGVEEEPFRVKVDEDNTVIDDLKYAIIEKAKSRNKVISVEKIFPSQEANNPLLPITDQDIGYSIHNPFYFAVGIGILYFFNCFYHFAYAFRFDCC
jgi:hypothetical protein